MFNIMITDTGNEKMLASFDCKNWKDFQAIANNTWCNLCETLPRNSETIFVKIDIPPYHDECCFHDMNHDSYYDLYSNKIKLFDKAS